MRNDDGLNAMRQTLRPLIGKGPNQITRVELARMTGIPLPTLTAFLRGVRSLPIAYRPVLARHFGLRYEPHRFVPRSGQTR